MPAQGAVLTAAEMRAAEAAAPVDLATLMERAGAALAEAVWRFGGGQETLILCGPGNNGGDGYVAARLLQARGLAVRVCASREPATGLANAARQGWTGPVEALEKARSAPVLLDCLFGTGLDRGMPAELQTALERLVGSARLVIAADLPSGMQTDTGEVLGGARADITVALGALKPAHILEPAQSRCGTVLLAPLPLGPAQSLVRVIDRPRLRTPGAGDHKYTRGPVTILAGAMPGAARLCAAAALSAGSGYVTVAGGATPGLAAAVVSTTDWQTAARDPRAGALVMGPGLGRDATASAMLRDVMAIDRPLVIDGDALRLASLHAIAARSAPTVLTPHDGEFDALFGELPGSKLERARAAARASNAVVVAKGPDTLVASPNGAIEALGRSSPWLATAGTGDVLAGAIGALLASGLTAPEAAAGGCWLHREAAQRCGALLPADMLAEAIRDVARDCL